MPRVPPRSIIHILPGLITSKHVQYVNVVFKMTGYRNPCFIIRETFKTAWIIFKRLQNMNHSVGVIIQLSPFQESCHRALLAVQKFLAPRGINHVIIVSSKEVQKKREGYDGLRIEYQVTPDGKPDYACVPFHLVHNIPPDVQCNATDKKRPNYNATLDDYLKRRVEKRGSASRHGIMPQVSFASSEWSFMYVFWALIFMIDWWRNVFASFTIPTGQYWTTYEVLHGYKRSVEAPSWSPWISCCGYWARGDRSALVASSRYAVAAGPSSDFAGWRYFLYSMYRRSINAPISGVRLWWIIYLLYWTLVGVAWWNIPVGWILQFFVTKTSFVYLAFEEYSNPLKTFQIVLKVFQMLFHAVILRRYVTWNHVVWSAFVPILMPLFMPFLGLVMVISNLYLRYPQYEDDVQQFDDEPLEKQEVPKLE